MYGADDDDDDDVLVICLPTLFFGLIFVSCQENRVFHRNNFFYSVFYLMRSHQMTRPL